MNPLNGVLVGSGSGGAVGTGDVVGPGSSTAGNLAEFGDTSGALLADSGVSTDNVATAASASVDNVVPRWDGVAKALQNSDLQVGDTAANSVPVSTTAGNALALAATAPVAATGASQAGKNVSIAASPAVASTDTAGAAAGGNITFTTGSAARNASGNADGGTFMVVSGPGVGTGRAQPAIIRTSGGLAKDNGVALSVQTDNGFDTRTYIDLGNQSYQAGRLGVEYAGGINFETSLWTGTTGGAFTKAFAVNGNDNGSVRIASGAQYGITSGTVDGNVSDVGWERLASSVWGPTNGSTGVGWVNNQGGYAALDSDFTNATATPENIAGLGITLLAGRKYTFRMSLFVSDSVAGEGVAIDFDGGTATATDFRAHVRIYDTTLLSSSQVTALATDVAVAAITGAGMIEVTGSFVVNAGGTFILRAWQNSHVTGTLTVERGSHIWVEDTNFI